MLIGECIKSQGSFIDCAKLEMHKVTVTHGREEPMIFTHEHYEKAHKTFLDESRNAAGYLVNKPGQSVDIKLLKPGGEVDKYISLTAHKV